MNNRFAAWVFLTAAAILFHANPASSMTFTAGQVNLADVDVYEYAYRNWNNANAGAWQSMSLGTNITGIPNTRRRVYIWFNVDALRPHIAAGERITLDLSYSLSDGNNAMVNVYRVAESWIEGEGIYHSGQVEPTASGGAISWNRQPAWDSARVWAQHRFSIPSGRASIDITELCRAWVTGQYANRGLMMAAADEQRDRFKIDFPTSESDRIELRPALSSTGGGGSGVGGGNALTITYCDGSSQTVTLTQSAAGIRSIDFGCGGGLPQPPVQPPAATSVQQFVTGGSYQVDVFLSTVFHSTWNIQVVNGRITGTSEWTCCPGPRVDQLRGHFQGDTVVIERDCSGQNWSGACTQVYTGRLVNGRIEGTCQGTGIPTPRKWVMY